MTIEDVLSPDTCVCRTEEGRILEGECEGDHWVVILLEAKREACLRPRGWRGQRLGVGQNSGILQGPESFDGAQGASEMVII